ncbi:uncharacterized protein C2845_PM11G22660 [Panicum miliaceum]|uniref:F-box/LRR-repeat protein n=1 Tax=Panicum miliaceum TaxID=4540 RepID=A0A3L6RQI7_PANMI|nr:uncharacterized protein C2845_PM11G22660 [Panicum miliaceum]
MAAGNFHDHRSRHIAEEPGAMVDDPADTADAGIDKISELPDDVLLDILGRLFAGPHRFWRQYHATAGFTDALARFLAAPPSKRSIQRLSLAFILTRRDYVHRIGDLVGDASDTGRVKNVELEILTEMSCSTGADAPLMVSYSERFRDFLKDCPGAFRSLTKLTLEFLWFEDQDALRNLVGGCNAFEFLSLKFCGLFRPRSPDLDDIVIRPAVLTIDAPHSRLKTLVCDHCYIERVELVQAPALVELQNRWFFDDHPPISFGCVPSLRSLSLTHHPHRKDDDGDIDVMKWKLSELLVRDGNQIQTLRFNFENDEKGAGSGGVCYLRDRLLHLCPNCADLRPSWKLAAPPEEDHAHARAGGRAGEREGRGKEAHERRISEMARRRGSAKLPSGRIWLQPEPPRKLRAALGGLKELHLTKIPLGYNLSWAMFLLEASPVLESLDIHIADHICRGEWRKRRGENTNLTWQPPLPGFVHHNLKKLSFWRAFNVYKDMGLARLIMELAVNLEALTFGVKTLECKDCVAAELNFPDPARSRLRLPGNSEHVNALVKKLKDGISTSALITIILPD